MTLAGVASPTVESAAAALLHSVVQNHPFFNGNKRAALVSMLVFLDRHNLVLESTQDQLFKFMIRIAAHDILPKNYLYDTRADREVFEIANWIRKNSRPLQKSERTINRRQLAQVLPQLECLVDQSKREKTKIRRTVVGPKRYLFRPRAEVLETYFINTGDGREVPKTQLKRIRHDLHLDVEHGFDSGAVYGDWKDIDAFIAEYASLLRRLAHGWEGSRRVESR